MFRVSSCADLASGTFGSISFDYFTVKLRLHVGVGDSNLLSVTQLGPERCETMLSDVHTWIEDAKLAVVKASAVKLLVFHLGQWRSQETLHAHLMIDKPALLALLDERGERCFAAAERDDKHHGPSRPWRFTFDWYRTSLVAYNRPERTHAVSRSLKRRKR